MQYGQNLHSTLVYVVSKCIAFIYHICKSIVDGMNQQYINYNAWS